MLNGRWLLLAIPAALVAAYAGAVLLFPTFGAPFLHERLADMPLAVVAHLSGGATALFAGAFQVNAALRRRALRVHRWLGRVYVAGVAVGGAGGLVLATRSQGGLVTHWGFGLLAIVWLVTTTAGYVRIRQRDDVTHRRWMLRSYALTFAAVTLRIYLPLAMIGGIPFIEAYRVISWACWVPNLVAIEWWLRRSVRVGAPPLTV